MRRAIAVALTHLGKTAPNPVVGCVIVRDGQVLAEAATAPGGRPHAEEQALEGIDARGATAYVTLEPCGARSTGTASCAQRLVAAGVTRVVYACEDPSPLASGQGSEQLIAAASSSSAACCHSKPSKRSDTALGRGMLIRVCHRFSPMETMP